LTDTSAVVAGCHRLAQIDMIARQLAKSPAAIVESLALIAGQLSSHDGALQRLPGVCGERISNDGVTNADHLPRGLASIIREATQLNWPGVSFNRGFFDKPSPCVRAQLFEVDVRPKGFK
jgi:hypothetical protein